MAIKNKDGSAFILRGPNLLMMHQQDWNKSKVRYINMGNWKCDVVEDAQENVVTIQKPEEKSVPVTAKQFLEELRTIPVTKPEPEPEPESKPEPPVNQELKNLFERKGYKYFCAPAIGTKTHVDSLYGNTYKTTQYGEKYLFDALVMNQNDLELVLWCMNQIAVNSIVYCKVKEGGERWWKIRSVEPKNGGYVLSAFPSDVSPDFS